MLSTRNAVVNIRSARFVILILVFITISALVESGVTSSFDESTISAMANARNASADAVMIVITTSADLFPIYFSPMIIFSFVLIIKKRTRRVGAILLLTIAISTLVTSYIKDLVDRERPTAYEFKPNLGFDYEPQQDMISKSSGSYPSGHAVRSAAFALIVSFLIRNRTLAGIPAGMLMWIFPILIALSRVYIGVHYPTDVVGGIILGVIIANVLSRILKLEPERQLHI